jgi:hypothetical protein
MTIIDALQILKAAKVAKPWQTVAYPNDGEAFRSALLGRECFANLRWSTGGEDDEDVEDPTEDAVEATVRVGDVEEVFTVVGWEAAEAAVDARLRELGVTLLDPNGDIQAAP